MLNLEPVKCLLNYILEKVISVLTFVRVMSICIQTEKKSALFRIATSGCGVFQQYCGNKLQCVAFTFFEKRMLTIFFTCCIIYFAVTAWSFKEEFARSENSGKFQKVFEKSKYQKVLKPYLESCLWRVS